MEWLKRIKEVQVPHIIHGCIKFANISNVKLVTINCKNRSEHLAEKYEARY